MIAAAVPSSSKTQHAGSRRRLPGALGSAITLFLVAACRSSPIGSSHSYDDAAANTIFDDGVEATEYSSQRESELTNRRPQTPISLTLPGAEVDQGRPVWKQGPLEEFLMSVGRGSNPTSEAQVITDSYYPNLVSAGPE